MGPSPHPSGYQFGVFELDLRTRELRRRGILVRLRGRPIEFLAALLERPAELVTRDELRARLWPADTFVDFDHGLNSAVNKLREALGDTADNPRFIETVPRRGYRWVGPLERLESPTGAPDSATVPVSVPSAPVDFTAPAPARERGRPARAWPLLALALTLLAGLTLWLSLRPPADSIATAGRRVMLVVLPFQNLGQPTDDVFTDGVTDEMIGQLGAIDPRRLGVIARTSSMQYKGTTKSVAEIGKELTVDYLLEGSVRRDANRARITAHLVDVASQTQLWSETYERDLDDVLMLQQDVATRISRSLAGGVLSPVLARQAPSPQFETYELVLKARALRQEATEESAWQCVATFEEALRQDPNYAPAHAGLGDCYRLLGAPGWEAGPPADLLNRARQAADRALALDPNLPDAWATRSMVRFNLDWDLAGASDDIDRAVELNPSLARAHQYRSAILTAMGQFDEAVTAAELARHLDPLSVTESTTLGIRLYYARRYPEAIQQLTQTSLLNPRFAVLSWALGEVYREMGKLPEALAHLRVAVELSNDSAYMRAWLAHALGAAGMKDEAERIRRDIEGLATRRYVSPFLFALMASGAGDREATLSWLEKTMDARSGWMPFIAVEPQFQWLRRDPAFQQMVARVRR
jgi:TolB-like protein/DNA-binding winged helix-turn-helix (wHTH) protein/tetratricopeptide (TPR) repeat protein